MNVSVGTKADQCGQEMDQLSVKEHRPMSVLRTRIHSKGMQRTLLVDSMGHYFRLDSFVGP